MLGNNLVFYDFIIFCFRFIIFFIYVNIPSTKQKVKIKSNHLIATTTRAGVDWSGTKVLQTVTNYIKKLNIKKLRRKGETEKRKGKKR